MSETTPREPIDLEAWNKRIGQLSTMYHDWREADLGHGSAPQEADTLWDSYAKEKELTVNSIRALIEEAERLRAENQIALVALKAYRAAGSIAENALSTIEKMRTTEPKPESP